MPEALAGVGINQKSLENPLEAKDSSVINDVVTMLLKTNMEALLEHLLLRKVLKEDCPTVMALWQI